MEQHPEKLRWRSQARGGLSASQFGSALGYCGRVSDYVTYQREHVGTILEFTGNAATEHGCRTESKARCCYCLATGLVVLNGGFFTSVDRELAASPDGIVIVPGSNRPTPEEQAKRPIRLLEIKSPYRALFDGSREGNKPHGIPIQYMCQMQGQMSLSGATECDFHIYLDGPQDCQLMCWRVFRDDRFWAWCEPKLRQVSSWIAHGLPPGIDRSFEFEGYDFSTLPVEPLLVPFSITTQRVTIDPRRYPFFFGRRPHMLTSTPQQPPKLQPPPTQKPRAVTTLLRRSSSASSSVRSEVPSGSPQPHSLPLRQMPTTLTHTQECNCGYCSNLFSLKSSAAQILFATSLDRALVFISHDNNRDATSIASLLAEQNSPAISLEGSVVVYDGHKCILEDVDWDGNTVLLKPLDGASSSFSIDFSNQEDMMKLTSVVTLPNKLTDTTSPQLAVPTRIVGHPTSSLSFTTAAALAAADTTTWNTPLSSAPSPPSLAAQFPGFPKSEVVPSERPTPTPHQHTRHAPSTSPMSITPLRSSSHIGIRRMMSLIQSGQYREDGWVIEPPIRRLLFIPSLTLGPLAFYLHREGGVVTASADGLSQHSGSQGGSSPPNRHHHNRGHTHHTHPPTMTTLICCPLDTLLHLVELCEGKDSSTAVVVSDDEGDNTEDASPSSPLSSSFVRNNSSTSQLGGSLSSSGTLLAAADLSQRVRESLIRRRAARQNNNNNNNTDQRSSSPQVKKKVHTMVVDEGSMDPSVAAVGRSLASRDAGFVFCAVSLREPTEELRRRWVSAAPPHVMHVRMSWPVFYRAMAGELRVGTEGIGSLGSDASPRPPR